MWMTPGGYEVNVQGRERVPHLNNELTSLSSTLPLEQNPRHLWDRECLTWLVRNSLYCGQIWSVALSPCVHHTSMSHDLCSRALPIFHLLNTNQRTKNWGGQGTRLELHWTSKSNNPSLVPRLLPRKSEREPGRFYHVSHDLVCVVLGMLLMIELLPTQSDLNHCPA